MEVCHKYIMNSQCDNYSQRPYLCDSFLLTCRTKWSGKLRKIRRPTLLQALTLVCLSFVLIFLQGKKKSKNGLQVTASSRATLTLANILIELVLHEYVRLRTRTLTMEERLHENMLLLRANLHRFPRYLCYGLQNTFP